MAKHRRKRLPKLTPRAAEIVRHVINVVALGNHDNEGDIATVAKNLEMIEGRLRSHLRKLEQQGYLTLKGEFIYPTDDALHWQNPALHAAETARVLKSL